jgi:hypothetical protein
MNAFAEDAGALVDAEAVTGEAIPLCVARDELPPDDLGAEDDVVLSLV